MQPNEYQELAVRTECDYTKVILDGLFNSENPFGGMEQPNPVFLDAYEIGVRILHAVIGLTGEAGELCSAMEKWMYYRQNRNDANIVEELGDCMWYIAQACTALGVSMEKVMEANIHKLQRRYPDKYQDELALEESRCREEEMKEVNRIMAEDNGPLYEEQMPTSLNDTKEKTRFIQTGKVITYEVSSLRQCFCPNCGFTVNDNTLKRMIDTQGLESVPEFGCPECMKPFSLETLVCRQ